MELNNYGGQAASFVSRFENPRGNGIRMKDVFHQFERMLTRERENLFSGSSGIESKMIPFKSNRS